MSANLTFIERLKLIWRILELLPRLEILDRFLPKIEAFESVLGKLEEFEKRTSTLTVLEATIQKIGVLEKELSKVENLEPTKIISTNGKVSQAVESIHEWDRLKLLSKFVALSGKAKEIEQEWQKIQQDENDASFAFQLARGDKKDEYLYKRGISEGIKWCINRFS